MGGYKVSLEKCLRTGNIVIIRCDSNGNKGQLKEVLTQCPCETGGGVEEETKSYLGSHMVGQGFTN